MVSNENGRGDIILDDELDEPVKTLAIGQTIIAVVPEDGSEVIGLRRDTLEELWTHEEHEETVNDVTVAGDGNIISCADSGEVIAVEPEEGELEWEHDEHASDVNTITSDDSTVYSGSLNSIVAVDAEEGTLQWQQSSGVEESVTSITVGDKFVYSSLENNEILALSTNDGEQEFTHDEHEEDINALAVGNALLISVADNGEVIAVVNDTGEKLWEHEHHETDNVYDVDVDDKYVYSVSDELIITHITDGEEVHTQTGLHSSEIANVRTNGSFIYTGGYDSQVNKILAGNRTAVRTLDYTVDGVEAELEGKLEYIDDNEDLDLEGVTLQARYRLQGAEEFSSETYDDINEAPEEFTVEVDNLQAFSDYEFRASAQEFRGD